MKKFLFLFISIAILFSCSKDNDSDLYSYDDPYGEQGIALINKVSNQCGDYIESYLQQYFSQNTDADIKDLVYKINHIDGVEEASPNDNNSVIIIKLKSGACFNYIIFTKSDDRLVSKEKENIIQQSLNRTNSSNSIKLRAGGAEYNTPTVKKALILDPFQSEWGENVTNLSMYLMNAGYNNITLKINNDVTIEHFRGDFLKQFGVIFISTHGFYQAYNILGDKSPMSFLITTATELNKKIFSSYSEEDRKNYALFFDKEQALIGVSDKWISENLNPLPNSLVYIDACYSAKGAQLPYVFLSNNAGAYVGWESTTNAEYSFPIAISVFNALSSGAEFDDILSTSESKSNATSIGYFLRKAQPNIPYYLIKKEEPDWVLINGVKWATRNVGTPGTFVQKPEDYGEYYQWNRGTTGFLSYKDYTNQFYGGTDSWLPANDPSPVGYHVPTLDEAMSLNTTQEFTTRNGVDGIRITDRASVKNIFLPIVNGINNYPAEIFEGAGSFYWNSNSSLKAYWTDYWGGAWIYSEEARCMGISSSGITTWNSRLKMYGFPIRPVKN